MDPKLLAIVALRGLAQLFLLQGNDKAHEALTLLAEGVQSGANVDEHMRSVAEVLNSDSSIDWDDVHARVVIEAEKLRARASSDDDGD